MLNICLLWPLSREGRHVKEERRGVWGCWGRDRKENKEEEEEGEEGQEGGRRRRVREHAISLHPQTHPAIPAWPGLLPQVAIKTTHAFPLHPSATSVRCGPGCQQEQLSPDVPRCKMRTQRCREGHRGRGGAARTLPQHRDPCAGPQSRRW